jgi:putative ABC transport system permease protein
MLNYELRLAWKSLKRTPWLTTMVVLAIGAGVGASTLFSALHHALGKDPLPGHSQELFYVRLDNWRADLPYPGDGAAPLPPQLAWRDVLALGNSSIPVRSTAAFETLQVFQPVAGSSERPFRERVRVCERDFFAMFRVPFAHGAAWPAELDHASEHVIVLSHELNARLFGGGNSVGRTARMAGREFRVVGVLAPWTPTVRYYDMLGDALDPPESAFVPLGLTLPLELRTSGDTDGWGPPPDPTPEGELMSEFLFIQFWVELPDAARVVQFRDYLDAYVLDQKRMGRFPRPVNNKLTAMRALMKEWNVVPKQLVAMQLVGYLFLAVCALNLIGLLLGKFLAQQQQVGVRRAFGASRWRVFLQYIVECESIALVSGAFGVAVAFAALALVNAWVERQIQRPNMVQLDLYVLALAILSALLAGLVAGLYPAWRISAVVPAAALKS